MPTPYTAATYPTPEPLCIPTVPSASPERQTLAPALLSPGRKLAIAAILIALALTLLPSLTPTIPTSPHAHPAVAASLSPWTLLSAAAGPNPRYTHGMVYDSRRDRVVLFGGDSEGLARLDDTWEHDGTRWSLVSPPASPPGRVNINESMVFDAERGVTVLFGGLGTGSYLDDTWTYDGATWRRIGGEGPPARDAHAVAYDAHRSASILFGGYASGAPLGDTWHFDGSWSRLATAGAPGPRFHHSMAFDAARGVVVLFGGRDDRGVLDDTWEFDGFAWRRVTTPNTPPPRENHRLLYDPSRGVVLFGGESGGGRILSDDWVYDGVSWQPLDARRGPSARKAMGLVTDARRERLVLFGGGYWIEGSLQAFGDTWALPFAGRSGVAYVPSVLNGGGTQPSPKPVSEADLRRDVLVLSFDPRLRSGERLSERMGWFSHEAISREAAAFFRETSREKVELRIVDWSVVDEWPLKVDGFRYDEDTYLAVMRGERPYHDPDGVDYDAIVADPRHDICGRANRDEIDEVWMFGAPYFGYYESRLVGPGGYWYNSPPMVVTHGCERLVPIMGFNYERDTDQAIHAFGHRAESAVWRAFRTWEQNRAAHDWERFAMVASASPDFGYSGCGNIHFPPNATSDYDYDNREAADSICEDFVRYPDLGPPAGARRPIACEAWGCTHLGYLRYWFGHLPAVEGCTDGRLNDWWRYIFEPERANSPAFGCS